MKCLSVTKAEEMPTKARDRPTGVTILSVFGIAWSVLSIPAGIAAFILPKYLETYSAEQGMQISFGSLAGYEILGATSIIMGIASLFAFYLLLKMKKAGWSLVMMLSIASIIIGIIFAMIYGILFLINSIFSVFISIIIMIYLWTKKDLFK